MGSLHRSRGGRGPALCRRNLCVFSVSESVPLTQGVFSDPPTCPVHVSNLYVTWDPRLSTFRNSVRWLKPPVRASCHSNSFPLLVSRMSWQTEDGVLLGVLNVSETTVFLSSDSNLVPGRPSGPCRRETTTGTTVREVHPDLGRPRVMFWVCRSTQCRWRPPASRPFGDDLGHTDGRTSETEVGTEIRRNGGVVGGERRGMSDRFFTSNTEIPRNPSQVYLRPSWICYGLYVSAVTSEERDCTSQLTYRRTLVLPTRLQTLSQKTLGVDYKDYRGPSSPDLQWPSPRETRFRTLTTRFLGGKGSRDE